MKYDIISMDKSQLTEFIKENSLTPDSDLINEANETKISIYKNKVFVRGLIEFTNYCKNNCYYCGINSANKNITRYRLSKEQILSCCENGYKLGFRSFVLQGGEDNYFTDKIMSDIIYSIKQKYEDCSITLSIGEKSRDTYKQYYNAGAERYLLRHESASEHLYKRLHPYNLTLKNRKSCLYTLKEIGFQIGAGFMVGAPYQTFEDLAYDLLFLKDLQPHMVGIGPFVSHKDTIYSQSPNGSLNLTILMLSLTRLMLKKSMLPSTTALATIAPNGRELGILAGANVVMPNLSPVVTRKNYSLYDNKASADAESAEGLKKLVESLIKIGASPDFSRGDHIDFQSDVK